MLAVHRWISGIVVVLGGALQLVFSETAHAQSSPATPPPLTPLRYGEDYSYLADPNAHSGAWWEPLKYIPLGSAQDFYLTLGGETRVRYEGYDNNNWGQGPATDDGYVWYRVLTSADLHLGPHLRLFGELIGAWEDGKQPVATPVDATDIEFLQGFADVSVPIGDTDTVLTVRPGRQLLSYGTERLVGVRYGPNVLRTFDAFKASLDGNGWRVDGFYGRPVETGLGNFNDVSHDELTTWGVYSTFDLPIGERSGFDLYYLGYDNKFAVFNEGLGSEHRHTVGARLFGATDGWDWDWELMYQFGRFAHGDIRAWSAASSTGYTFEDMLLSPRLGIKANIISGDSNPHSGGLQTFNPMFPKGKYFGELTLLGPENLINLHSTLDLHLGHGLSLGGAGVFYWRESTGDAIYDIGGNVIRDEGGTDARFIGSQAEIVLTYEYNRNVNALLSYSEFFPGSFIDDTGPSKTVHFVGAELQLQF